MSSLHTPILLKQFDTSKITLGKTKKDIYGGSCTSFVYNNETTPIVIRIEAPLFTFGISHIKEFVNKDHNTGKFQIACLPYKDNLPNMEIESEKLFYNVFEKNITDRLMQLALSSPETLGLNLKIHNEVFIKSIIKDIIWRKTDSKSYLFLKLRSRTTYSGRQATFANILTPFFDKLTKNKILSSELGNKKGNIYIDIVLHGIYQKQKASNILTQISLYGATLEEVKDTSSARDF